MTESARIHIWDAIEALGINQLHEAMESRWTDREGEIVEGSPLTVKHEKLRILASNEKIANWIADDFQTLGIVTVRPTVAGSRVTIEPRDVDQARVRDLTPEKVEEILLKESSWLAKLRDDRRTAQYNEGMKNCRPIR
jgi:hypothetical protein